MNQGLYGWPMPQSAAVPYLNIQDQKATGTNGGTFTSGAWQTRTLNTVQSDSAGIASLAANQVTLPPGTYRCHIRTPGRAVQNHQARLRNITLGATTLVGSNARDDAAQAASDSWIIGQFTITSTTIFEVQDRCSLTGTTNGFGVTNSFGEVEVYTVAEFWRLS